MHLLALAAALVAQAPGAPAQPPAQAAPPPACTAPEHRQFDFWVGRWDVYPTGTHQLVAHSLIERLYNGCAIRENWMPVRAGAGGGGSLNSWRPGEHRWRQTWTDSGNSWVEFTGALDGADMVLTAPVPGPNGAATLSRMTYSRGADGSVRQVGTQSSNGGRTWTAQYDFTYVPAAG
jgi:hypothetical protein